MCSKTGTARGDAYDRNTALPAPGLSPFTQAKTNPLIAESIFNHEPADQRIRIRLQPVFNGDLDPADDLAGEARDKRGLDFCPLRKHLDPLRNLGP